MHVELTDKYMEAHGGAGGAGGSYVFCKKYGMTLHYDVPTSDQLPSSTVKKIKKKISVCKILQNHNFSCMLGRCHVHTCKELVAPSATVHCARRSINKQRLSFNFKQNHAVLCHLIPRTYACIVSNESHANYQEK